VVEFGEQVTMLYGYARVSTDRQENSADAQAIKLRAYAEQSGLEFGGVFVDEDQSAYKIPLNKRRQGSVLWDKLKAGDVVAFTTFDRVFRSVLDAAITLDKCKELGIQLRFLDNSIDVMTSEGELTFNVRSCVAQFESQIKAQRQREIQSYLREAGRPYGKFRPYGWVAKDKAFVVCPAEREIGDMVVAMRKAGRSMADICLHLCKKELRKPANKQGVRGYYGLSDTIALHRAAAAGYPKLPPRLSQAQWHAEMQRVTKSHASQPAL
jgi:DNA invertase Pin-like site-specific DNA recombinase